MCLLGIPGMGRRNKKLLPLSIIPERLFFFCSLFFSNGFFFMLHFNHADTTIITIFSMQCFCLFLLLEQPREVSRQKCAHGHL